MPFVGCPSSISKLVDSGLSSLPVVGAALKGWSFPSRPSARLREATDFVGSANKEAGSREIKITRIMVRRAGLMATLHSLVLVIVTLPIILHMLHEKRPIIMVEEGRKGRVSKI